MGALTSSSASSNSPVKAQSMTRSVGAHEQRLPLTLFILPQRASPAARFILLKHPHDGIKQRFYFCPTNALYEIKKVNTPTTDPRSILFTTPNESPPTSSLEVQEFAGLRNGEKEDSTSQRPAGMVDFTSGHVNKSAEVFVATPFDMVFILIPLLSPRGSSTKPQAGKALFQPLDDMLDIYLEGDKHLRYILEKGRPILENAAAKICDSVEAGHEKMFRLNEDKLFKTIFDKAQCAVNGHLPASLEEKFVKRALEKPILSIKRGESSLSVMTDESSVDGTGVSFGTDDSQCGTIASAASAAASEMSSTTTIAGSEDEAIPAEIIKLQRLRIAWSFITSSYLPNYLADSWAELLSSEYCPIDFAPLETYLNHLATLRTETLASRSLSGFGQKRGPEGDDAFEMRAEKKRKQEDDEKRRKAGESRGVRDLKKVDVSDMKKMSAFFTKTATTKTNS